MVERYTRPEMGKIWADENKYNIWLIDPKNWWITN